MEIKANPKTGETSIKLTEFEKRTVATAMSIFETITNNVPRATRVEDEDACHFYAAVQHVKNKIRKYIDQPAEAVMDPEQTGVMEEPAKKLKREH